jgi:triosephosphate isomerase
MTNNYQTLEEKIMRKKIVAGNWKMNKTPKEAIALVNELKDKVNTSNVDVVFCVPFIDIFPVLDAVKGTNIKVAAQNMHYEESGAYTGEISASMLKEIGVEYVVLGHSERRAYFAETDETVNKKVLKAIEHNLTPIICVGESLEQREQGVTFDLVRMQTKIALKGVEAAKAKEVVIAYEPIWAIGTGKTATSEQAQEVCAQIRKVLAEIYDQATADVVRIQYGGSVSGSNATELFGMADIDGGLVGGASLKADFEKIVNY